MDLINDVLSRYIQAIDQGFGLIDHDVVWLLNVLVILNIVLSAIVLLLGIQTARTWMRAVPPVRAPAPGPADPGPRRAAEQRARTRHAGERLAGDDGVVRWQPGREVGVVVGEHHAQRHGQRRRVDPLGRRPWLGLRHAARSSGGATASAW